MNSQNAQKQYVEIYDTTLRDGSQGEGITFSVEDKIRIARRLDEFGMDFIEGGWPGSNPKDATFFERMKTVTLHHARLAAFGSTRRAGLRAEDDAQLKMLVDAATPVITIFGKSWTEHVLHALKTTPHENLDMIGDSVAFLKRTCADCDLRRRAFFRWLQEQRGGGCERFRVWKLRAGGVETRIGRGRGSHCFVRYQWRHTAV